LPEVIVFHPGAEMYGADRMVIESVVALVASMRVTVVLPETGPLVDQLRDAGAAVIVRRMAVLRKALVRPALALTFLSGALRDILLLSLWLRRRSPAVVIVSTITLPSVVAAARLARMRVICHAHEAESVGRPVRLALTAPLLLADAVVAASEEVGAFVTGSFRRIREHCVTVENAVPDVEGVEPLASSPPDEPLLVVVGRLSPRKGSDIAVEALAHLRSWGIDARLALVGSPFRGYEWFEANLHERIAGLALQDAVEFAGFRPDPSSWYRAAAVVVVPSRVEPFGLVAVEGQLHQRPVVVSAVGGLRSIIDDGKTGLHFEAGSARDLAEKISGLLSDWDSARLLARNGRSAATDRFSIVNYRVRFRSAVAATADLPPRSTRQTDVVVARPS
jgi:glycosyltransferase involved in cell wall biosynthesis